MITINENYGNLMLAEIERQGFTIVQKNGTWITSNDLAVQLIIDSYDPLPKSKKDALALVKAASAKKRLKFVTQAAGKDAEYIFKAQEAAQFGIDASIGVYMQARMDETLETAAQVASTWNASATSWKTAGAHIAALEDKANAQINALTDWKQCENVANAIIAELEAI